ncbi:MAG: hypothetical protein WBY44_32660 [Bryobacteraceae bacterium]|jgi:hypothetical protein
MASLPNTKLVTYEEWLDVGSHYCSAPRLAVEVLSQGVLKPTRFPHVQIDIASIWPD